MTFLERIVNEVLIDRRDLTVYHRAKTDFVGRFRCSTRCGDVAHRGDAACKRLERAKVSGLIRLFGRKAPAKIGDLLHPGCVGDVAHETTKNSIFKTRVKVNQARADSGGAEIAHLFFRITNAQHVCFANVGDLSVFDQNSAVFDRRRRDG